MPPIRQFKCGSIVLLGLLGTMVSPVIAQDAANLPEPVSAQYQPTSPYQSTPQFQNFQPAEEDHDRFIPEMTSLGSIAEGFEKVFRGEVFSHPGTDYPDRAYWSAATIKLVNPREYARIDHLDNDDPNSIFYTQRPNFFNIAIPDEWDWYNLINTDRPDFTDTPFSVGEGMSILEAGITNTRVNSPDAHSTLRSMLKHCFVSASPISSNCG